MNFNAELDADLAEIISEHPTKVAFSHAGNTYTGAKSFTKDDGSAMLPQGYDPEADFQLIVRTSQAGVSAIKERDFVTVGGQEYKVVSLSRNPVFIALNCKLIA